MKASEWRCAVAGVRQTADTRGSLSGARYRGRVLCPGPAQAYRIGISDGHGSVRS